MFSEEIGVFEEFLNVIEVSSIFFAPHKVRWPDKASNPIGIRTLPVCWTLEPGLFFGGDKEKRLTLGLEETESSIKVVE